MRRITSAIVAASATVLLTSALAAAQGQIVDNRLTNVTFSAPVSVPGHTLPAGTYHFQLLDSQTNRNVVQIFDKDNKLMATMLAVPAKRNQQEGDPVITFKETRADQPPAVHYWYYAGESTGSELVYPRSQAMEIARASGESVMATDTESNETNALKNSKITSVNPSDANAQSSQTTTTTTQPGTTTASQQPTQPTSAPVTTAPTTTTEPRMRPTTAPEPTTPTTTAEQPTPPTSRPESVGTSGRSAKALPKTASNMPEIGLIGLIALSAGLGVRYARKSLV